MCHSTQERNTFWNGPGPKKKRSFRSEGLKPTEKKGKTEKRTLHKGLRTGKGKRKQKSEKKKKEKPNQGNCRPPSSQQRMVFRTNQQKGRGVWGDVVKTVSQKKKKNQDTSKK